MRLIQDWLRDLNTDGNDTILAFAADRDGNLFVAGYTEHVMVSAGQMELLASPDQTTSRKDTVDVRDPAELGIDPATGEPLHSEAWLMCYRPDGQRSWCHTLATRIDGLSMALTADRDGDLLLAARSDDMDANLTKYGARGNKLWSLPLQTPNDNLLSVATDGNKNTYLVATDTDGDNHTIHCFGSNSKLLGKITNVGDVSVVAVDRQDSLIIAGRAPRGVFVGKLQAGGQGIREAWRRQLDMGDNEAVTAVNTDAMGNIYLTGTIDDEFANSEIDENADVWLARYNADGGRQWYQLITNTTGEDAVADVMVDPGGYIYVAGHTKGEVASAVNGEQDLWVAKYLPDSTELWRQQHAITDEDRCFGLALDGKGNIYLAGITEPQGALPNDAWVARLREEPATPAEVWALMRAYMLGQ
jgi:hypothetical protein